MENKLPPGAGAARPLLNITADNPFQRQADEATVFVMARSMLSMYIALANEDHDTVKRVMSALADVFAKDPTFIERFKKAQHAVMDKYNQTVKAEEDKKKLVL